ncbi:MAG: hypothetical protein KF721_10820 [Ignavibacteriaceae bacterium]|nr:hypothetical protein [Ignavibacteriaceae bacterium]
MNTLSNEDKSTFFHEYTHFLQDLTTTFGLTNIINTVNVQKAINDEILKSNEQKTFKIPVSIENYPDTDIYHNLNEMFYGDFESVFNRDSIIEKIELVENGIILGHEDKKYVKVSFSNFHNSHSFQFGAIQIMENMAFLIERNLFDNVTSPTYPYRVVEKIIEHLYPSFQGGDKEKIMICDYSLMAPDPGKFMIEFISKLEELKVNSVIGIYEVLKKYNFHSTTSGQMTVFNLYEERYELALRSIKEYFTIELFDEIKNWLDSLFDEISTFKLENFNFWLDILNHSTKQERQTAFIQLTIKFGFPLISNNNGKIVFYHPNHRPEHLLVLKAINEVAGVLNRRQEACGMKKCCEKGYEGDITNNDCNSPWLRGSQDPLCPFGQVIKMWGLYEKMPLGD